MEPAQPPLDACWVVARQLVDTSWEFLSGARAWTSRWSEAGLFAAHWMAVEACPRDGRVHPARDVHEVAVAGG